MARIQYGSERKLYTDFRTEQNWLADRLREAGYNALEEEYITVWDVLNDRPQQYKVDIMLKEQRIAILMDGGAHDSNNRNRKDNSQNNNLLNHGLKVLRLRAEPFVEALKNRNRQIDGNEHILNQLKSKVITMIMELQANPEPCLKVWG